MSGLPPVPKSVTDPALRSFLFAVGQAIASLLARPAAAASAAPAAAARVTTASVDSAALAGKQDTLVSGVNIKTVNNTSLLGAGDVQISATATWGSIGGTLSSQTDLNSALAGKQATLVSGTSIKTINGTSVLGSGDITITGTISDGDKGDITVSASGATWTVDNNVVSEAKMTLSDITTHNVSTTMHGFVPKAPNDTAQFLRGDGAWAALPSGSGLSHPEVMARGVFGGPF